MKHSSSICSLFLMSLAHKKHKVWNRPYRGNSTWNLRQHLEKSSRTTSLVQLLLTKRALVCTWVSKVNFYWLKPQPVHLTTIFSLLTINFKHFFQRKYLCTDYTSSGGQGDMFSEQLPRFSSVRSILCWLFLISVRWLLMRKNVYFSPSLNLFPTSTCTKFKNRLVYNYEGIPRNYEVRSERAIPYWLLFRYCLILRF